MIFWSLVRLRGRLGRNAARSAPVWHKVLFTGFSLVTVALAAAIALACAVLVLLAQGSAHAALTPAARGLVGHVVEFVFLLLTAGSVPFVAATLFQAGDLPLLLAAPTPPRAVMAAKLLDAALANAGPSLAFGVPALIGVGAALRLAPAGWLGLLLALLLLLILCPSITALLLLLGARVLGMRSVRTAVALVSVALGLGVTLLAVAGASHAAQTGLLDPARISAAVQGRVPPSSALSLAPADPLPAWLPSSWAAAILADTAFGGSVQGDGIAGLLGLFLLAAALVGGCLAVGPSVLASEAFLETESAGAGMGPSGARPRLPALSLPVAGLLWKDLKYVARDLVLMGQVGTALILYLVPFFLKIGQGTASGPDNDLYGDGALLMLAVIVYMATSILALTSVGLEGRGGWMVFASPVGAGAFLRAKWLMAGGLSYGIVLVLTLLAWPMFGLPRALVGEALAVYFCACFALSGLGVGLSGLFPRFIYENPAHRASISALILGFAGATGYLIVAGLIGTLAYFGVTEGGLPQNAVLTLAGSGLVFISLLTGLVPVGLAARRLRDYEWEG